MLVLDRSTGALEDRFVRDLPGLLRPGDALVVNDSRVLPARIFGRRSTGGRVELLLLRREGDGTWTALARPARRLNVGEVITIEGPGAGGRGSGVGGRGSETRGREGASGRGREETSPPDPLSRRGEGEPVRDDQPVAPTGNAVPPSGFRLPPLVAVVVAVRPDGIRVVRFSDEEAALQAGRMPLPPYITAPLGDPERYQTVYSRELGSAAAPTAGLHFTPELLDRIRVAGIAIHQVTLHVGLDTFRPVNEDDPVEHQIHSEWCSVTSETAAALNETRANGGRIVAVGTTAVRTLESAAREDGTIAPYDGPTRLYILPGYRFRAVDIMLTNFHLPRSTLLMLVAAFAGRERILGTYEEAIRRGYRFYSFGDAMLIR